MAKKKALRPLTSNNRATTSSAEVAQQLPNDLPCLTSDGKFITPQVARELAEWRRWLMPNVVAAKVWEQLLTADDRARLGGDLSEAWFNLKGTMGIYMRARHVTYERAILEIAWGLGQIHEANYQRLLSAIGGQNAGNLVPNWDRQRLQLSLGDRIIKAVRSRQVVPSVCRVLDAFEEDHWQPRIDDPMHGGSDTQRLREVVRSLNRGLEDIYFAADGRGPESSGNSLDHPRTARALTLANQDGATNNPRANEALRFPLLLSPPWMDLSL